MKILIAEPEDFSEAVIAKLRKHATVDVEQCEPHKIKWALENYDVFWFRLAHKMNADVLTENSRCKILATPVTGIDHIDIPLCEKLGIQIVCLKGEREFLKEVRATSEMAIGLAMSVMRNIPRANEAVKKGEWERDLYRGNELYKKTIGIIGFGRLGAIMADYAKAFGMKIVAVEPREETKIGVEGVEFLSSLEELARVSDVISLHVNYNEETHHLLNESFFKACKASSFFINTSRGGIVDEKALVKALENKWIQGAGLDVLQGEPEVQNNVLIQYAKKNKNIVIVPHIGGNTYESFEKTEHFIADKIIKLIGT